MSESKRARQSPEEAIHSVAATAIAAIASVAAIPRTFAKGTKGTGKKGTKGTKVPKLCKPKAPKGTRTPKATKAPKARKVITYPESDGAPEESHEDKMHKLVARELLETMANLSSLFMRLQALADDDDVVVLSLGPESGRAETEIIARSRVYERLWKRLYDLVRTPEESLHWNEPVEGTLMETRAERRRRKFIFMVGVLAACSTDDLVFKMERLEETDYKGRPTHPRFVLGVKTRDGGSIAAKLAECREEILQRANDKILYARHFVV